jgi:hypothetical protein
MKGNFRRSRGERQQAVFEKLQQRKMYSRSVEKPVLKNPAGAWFSYRRAVPQQQEGNSGSKLLGTSFAYQQWAVPVIGRVETRLITTYPKVLIRNPLFHFPGHLWHRKCGIQGWTIVEMINDYFRHIFIKLLLQFSVFVEDERPIYLTGDRKRNFVGM